MREPSRVVARCADAVWELCVEPGELAPERGGYFLVLKADGTSHFDADLIHIPPGASVELPGVERGLLLSSPDVDASPPPPAWTEVASPPFAPFEHNSPAPLPVSVEGMEVSTGDDPTRVAVRCGERVAQVPRHWLARLLFRVALHGYRLGYVETYEGFYYDDTDGTHRLGLRGGDSVSVDPKRIAEVVEGLYRAVAPDGYHEDLRP